MISKSKRMRYRWIYIEGDLGLNLKEFKIKWKHPYYLRISYQPDIVQLMVYRDNYLVALKEIYHQFFLKGVDLSHIKIRVLHSYKKTKV